MSFFRNGCCIRHHLTSSTCCLFFYLLPSFSANSTIYVACEKLYSRVKFKIKGITFFFHCSNNISLIIFILLSPQMLLKRPLEIGKVDRKVGEEIGAVKSVLASIANVYSIYPCQTSTAWLTIYLAEVCNTIVDFSGFYLLYLLFSKLIVHPSLPSCSHLKWILSFSLLKICK